ncbi:MAG: CoA transferase [Robiginitomaculum sp.]
MAVSGEPLIAWDSRQSTPNLEWEASLLRPLNGLKVLDMTRVLAGPVATRTLAGFGANVLRIDPPGWEEANIAPDVTLDKKCARLDLTAKDDREIFEGLLSEADVLIHGYRPGALETLGYGDKARLKLAPSLIEITLNAYGWSGPWQGRRGFDSLVQMSSGIADAGAQWASKDMPYPLPVQALDHATGYLMAAAAIRAITQRAVGAGARSARLSLARTAELLCSNPQTRSQATAFEALAPDFSSKVEQTPWGAAKRLLPALVIDGAPMEWASPACNLGTSAPQW